MWKQYKAGFWFELLVDFDTLGRRQTLDSPRSWRRKWNGMSFHRVSHLSSMKVERKKEKLRHTRLKNITHNSLLPFTSLDKSVQDDDMNHSDLTVCHLVGQIFGFLFFVCTKSIKLKCYSTTADWFIRLHRVTVRRDDCRRCSRFSWTLVWTWCVRLVLIGPPPHVENHKACDTVVFQVCHWRCDTVSTRSTLPFFSPSS